jgi:acid phosphatase (class A)
MKRSRVVWAVVIGLRLAFAAALVFGQAAPVSEAPNAVKAPKVKVPNFVDPTLFDLTALLPPPPAQDGPVTKAELAEIHQIEATRTPAEVAAAQYDDQHEEMFLYATVIGPSFTEQGFPITAAFSAHVRSDAGLVDSPLKAHYGRPRPYNFDKTLHPVCETNTAGSYPSGHSMNGFVFGFVLAQMVPEKKAEILARANEYAHHRMICEAHYASDIEASRAEAGFVVGAMMANARFQKEMAAAKVEIRGKIGLPVAP